MKDETRRSLRSNVEWRKWGEADPLWSVATWHGKSKSEASPWSEAEFYSIGATDWKDFHAHWQRYGLNRENCVEIGCGAGRITAHLQSSFERVYALDVSPGMIAYAAARIRNAKFVLTNGVDIPLNDSSVTAAFSTHVLQHLDAPENALPIFLEVHRVLIANGTMMIHLPLYEWPSIDRPLAILFERVFRTRQSLSRLKAALQRKWGTLIMRGTWFERAWLTGELRSIGFQGIEFTNFAVASNGTYHSFVFARK